MMKRKRTPIMHYHQCTVAKVSRYQNTTIRSTKLPALLLYGRASFARSTVDGELGHDIEIV